MSSKFVHIVREEDKRSGRTDTFGVSSGSGLDRKLALMCIEVATIR